MGPKTSKHQQASSYEQQHYRHNVRVYPGWNHQTPLASNNVPRLATQELQNLQKHKQLISSLPLQTSAQQDKALTSLPNNKVGRKKPHCHTDMQRKQLGIRKSRSTGNLSSLSTVITAEQLLRNEAKRRQRNKSSSSQTSKHSSQSQSIEKSSSTTSLHAVATTSKSKRKKIPSNLQLVLINPHELQNAREIGHGNFGTVYHASYKGTHDVAIKRLKSPDENSPQASVDDSNENMYELLHEANIMTRLKHGNLLRIIGVTFFGEQRQLSLVTDFMKNGSLSDYLRKSREIFLKSNSRDITKRLNSFGRQIFDAMLYLEERGIIHRDLAARNCLIGERDTLKVGDFGLTTLTECGLYKGTYRTICAPRWTSPEALFSSKYSSRSDVWSYGITLWEIYSLGDRPFSNLSNYAVQAILKNSSENLSRHLPKPHQFGTDATYTHIILPCLTYNAAMRPRFRDLKERLLTILSAKA